MVNNIKTVPTRLGGNIYKKRKKIKVWDVVLGVIALILGVLCLYPVMHTVFASLSDPAFIRSNGGLLLYPHGFNIDGYKVVFSNNVLIRSLFNSILYVVVGVSINMVLTTMGAFVLSRRKLCLNKLFMFIIVFTMFFGGGLLPLYRLVGDLGLNDNWLALVIPVAVSQWNLIVLRTAFMAVPEEIYESARIDGCSNFKIMLLISVPLVKATMAIITLYYTVGHWNSWFTAMLYIRDRDWYPLQLVLREILILNDTSKIDAGSIMQSEQALNLQVIIKYCTTVVAIVPMLIIFPFVQKYFTKGVYIGSLK